MCQKHYWRLKKTGTTDAPQPVTHCPQKHEYTPENTYTHRGKRKCNTCRRERNFEAWKNAPTPPPCSVEDCETPRRRKDWCLTHFKRWEKYGDPLAGPPIQRKAKTPEEKKQRQIEAAQRYRAANPEKEQARLRKYRQENWEQVKAGHYRWREENSGQWHATVYRARQKRLDLLGPDAEIVDREAILAAFGMVCHLCGGEIESRKDLEFDHVIPIVRGGGETWDNIRPSHMFCNRSKGAKLLP